jgi:hypothetical protein
MESYSKGAWVAQERKTGDLAIRKACGEASEAIIFDFSCFIKLYFINLH